MLGYRSTFAINMEDTDTTDRDHVVGNVLGEGLTWLRKTKGDRDIDSVEPGTPTTLESGREVVFLHETMGSGSEFARLVAIDPPDTSGQRWVTDLLVGIDHKKGRHGRDSWPLVAIEIDAPPDPTVPARARWTSRPRLVQGILGAYSCDDHGFLMGDGPRSIDVEQVDDLLGQLAETDHHGLVILCGEDGTVPRDVWADRLARITRETLGQASAFLLSEEAMEAFNGSVSAAHALSPYSPRTFRPGAVLDDPHDAYRHRAISMKTLLGERIDDLTRSFGRASREHANQRPLDRYLRRLDEISSIRLDEAARTASHGSHVNSSASVVRTVGPISPASPTPSRGPAQTVAGGTHTADPLQFVERDSARMTGMDRTHLLEPTSVQATSVGAGDAGSDTVEQIRVPTAELEAQLSALKASLRTREEELEAATTETERITAESEARAIRSRDEFETLQSSLRTQLEDERLERAILADEVRDIERQLRTARYQLDAARALMDRTGTPDTVSWLEPEKDPYDEPVDSWEDLQTYAEMDVFDHLRFVGDWEDARDLADHDTTGTWVHYTWDALAMLNDYARCRTDPTAALTVGLREFLSGHAPAGSHLIPGGRVRFNESETVRNNREWMRERTCSVPVDIDPSGKLAMVCHIVIQTRGSICPRLYFEDRTADLGQVIVGRIGSHPTNTKTN